MPSGGLLVPLQIVASDCDAASAKPGTPRGKGCGKEEKEKGIRLPEFLSTHPSDETIIKDIQAALPEALKYYNP